MEMNTVVKDEINFKELCKEICRDRRHKEALKEDKEYAVEVIEVFTLKRTYIVDAPNAKEARRNAEDWNDAYDGWDSDDYVENIPEMDKIVVKKVRRNY